MPASDEFPYGDWIGNFVTRPLFKVRERFERVLTERAATVLASCHSLLRKATLAAMEVFQSCISFPVELSQIPWRFVGLPCCGTFKRHVRSRHAIFKHANHLAAKLLPLAARLPASAQLNQLWKARIPGNVLVAKRDKRAWLIYLRTWFRQFNSSTRMPHPHGAYVQMSGRNRIGRFS